MILTRRGFLQSMATLALFVVIRANVDADNDKPGAPEKNGHIYGAGCWFAPNERRMPTAISVSSFKCQQ